MLKFGIISQIDAAKGLARVKFDDLGIVSNWLHVAVAISYKDQLQFPLFVNQHVYCHMDDQCERGVVAGAIYDEKNTPAGGDANVVQMKFENGLQFKYDRGAKKLSVTGTGDVEINTTGKLDATVTGDANVSCLNAKITATVKCTIDAPIMEATGILKASAIQTTGPTGSPGLHIDENGNMTTTGDFTSTGTVQGAAVKEGAIQLGTHKHIGVTTGSGTSGTPTP